MYSEPPARPGVPGPRGDLRVELREKIESAYAARGAVRAMSPDERLAIIRRVAARVGERGAAIAEHAIREGGVRKYADDQVREVVRLAESYDRLVDRIRPRPLSSDSRDWIRREPFGVVGLMLAGNAPVILAFVALAASFGAGNATVVRPSAMTPASSGAIVDLFVDECPPGAVQSTSCGAEETSIELAESPLVHAVLAYAGSAKGKEFIARLGRHYEATRANVGGVSRIEGRLKKFIPELAGNDAMIVLPGADLDFAAEGAAIAAFANSGQVCFAAKRFIVHRDVEAAFVARFLERVARFQVGDPRDPETDIGPITRSGGRSLAIRQLEDALEKGGRVLVGGGYDESYVHPTLIAFDAGAILGRTDGEKPLLWSEECFAPIRSMVVCDGDEQAVALAADSVYGLGASLYGPEGRCLAIAERIDAGRIIINESPSYRNIALPFGGVQDSGFYGATHKIEELTYAKVVHVGTG